MYCKERIKRKFYEEEAAVRAQVKLEKGRIHLKRYYGHPSWYLHVQSQSVKS